MGDNASSGEVNLLSLNSFCLHKIFRLIELNCKNANEAKDTLGKYLDLINFAVSSEILNKAFKEWNPELYDKLRIAQDFLNKSPSMTVDLSNLYKFMQSQPKGEQKLYWSAYLNAIKENEELESVKVIYKPARYYPEHLDRFEDLVKVLKKKNTLRELGITIKGYTWENVEFENLETLHLDARVDVYDLVRLCQRNPNLRRLKLSSYELSETRLSDIVPYCNQMEYLTITMKEGQDATEYAPLAELPQLKDLTLLGEPEEGSLLKLLEALKEKAVERISIPNVFITYEELYALSVISSLVSLKYCPRDFPNGFSLSKSGNLKKTYRLCRPQRKPRDWEPVKYRIRASVDVKAIYNVESFDDILESIGRGEDSLETRTQLIYDWNELLQSSQFVLEGWVTIDDLCLIPESYSKNVTSEVTKIELSKNMPITQKEVAALASYPSILYIRCSFHQLEQMIAVKLLQLEGYTCKVRREDRIRSEHCEVRLSHVEDSVTLVLDFFEKNSSINAGIFAPLVTLKHLQRLEIKGNTVNGSLVALFKSFASMEKHTLLELKIAFLSPEEVAEVAKIRSLILLECGFFCSRNIDHLAAMNQLELLRITVHPLGSLKALFKALALKKDPTLSILWIERTGLTSEEVSELVGIESLLGLKLGLADKEDWEHTTIYRTGSLYVRYCQKCQLPPSGSDNVPHHIHTRTLPFEPHEAGLETQARFLTELYETLTPINLNLLADLPRLRSLLIYFGYTKSAMDSLWMTLALESPKRLSKITFASQDFKFMSQFEELQYLECFFYHIQDIDSIGLLENLSELVLHNPQGIEMWEILRELRELPNLEALVLTGKDLDNYEMAGVANIRTLKRLRIGLASNEWFKYLILLKNLEILEVTSTHYANENEVDYVNFIFMKCIKLREIFLHRYYGYITRDKMGKLLSTIKTVRNPIDNPSLLLRGIWADFERLKQLYSYNDIYLRLESITDNGYLSSDESDEDSNNEP